MILPSPLELAVMTRMQVSNQSMSLMFMYASISLMFMYPSMSLMQLTIPMKILCPTIPSKPLQICQM